VSNPLLIQLFQHKAWANREQIKALEAVPADAPRREMGVILRTLDHTVNVDRIFKARLAGEAPDIDYVTATKRPALGEIAARMAETDAWYRDYVARVTDAELEQTVDFTFVSDGDPGRMTKAEILSHIITHGASHRGAIGKMLEALEIVGAPDMVTTFVSTSANNAG
jgi:uncharacterized damage-inducible protein DinB